MPQASPPAASRPAASSSTAPSSASTSTSAGRPSARSSSPRARSSSPQSLGSVRLPRRRVGGGWPAHVEDREWPAVVVERGAADDDEAECLVEPERGGVLLIDVHRQRSVT